MLFLLGACSRGLGMLAAAAVVAAVGLGGGPPAHAATFAVANPYATGLNNGDIHIRTVHIFGDSYSALGRKSFHNWAEQLRFDDGSATGLDGVAKSGATAGGFPPSTNDFAHQVTRWLKTSPPPTFVSGPDTDLTVVYLGQNDIAGGTDQTGADLANSEADYKAALRRVITADGGATNNGRRVLLIMPQNWGRGPLYVREGGTKTMRLRTKVWDSFVAKTAQNFSSTYGNIIAVDLYTCLERVFNNPGAFGLTNITTADPAHSDTTAFFDDDLHPGAHGQGLIEQVIQYYLTRGWDWANQIKNPTKALAKLNADLDAGKVFTPQAAMVATDRQAPSASSSASTSTSTLTVQPPGATKPEGVSSETWARFLHAGGFSALR